MRGLSGFPSCGTKNLRDPLAFRAFSERLSARRMTVWSNSALAATSHRDPSRDRWSRHPWKFFRVSSLR